MIERYPMYVFDIQDDGQTRPIGIAVHAHDSESAVRAAIEVLNFGDVNTTIHLVTTYYPD